MKINPDLKGPIIPLIYFRIQVVQKQARASANLLLQKTGLINQQKFLENGSNLSQIWISKSNILTWGLIFSMGLIKPVFLGLINELNKLLQFFKQHFCWCCKFWFSFSRPFLTSEIFIRVSVCPTFYHRSFFFIQDVKIAYARRHSNNDQEEDQEKRWAKRRLFFYVTTSGGPYSSIYITVYSPNLIIFAHWTQLFRI